MTETRCTKQRDDADRENDERNAPKGPRRISRRDICALVEAFAPLIAAVARRYEGRGAEFDDLKQEGYVALLQIARATNKRHFVQTLARTLPGRVRDAAGRMRHADGTLSLYAPVSDAEGTDETLLCETIADPDAGERTAGVELRAAFDTGLTAVERATAHALAEGHTYDEIAAETNATKQAVANRVRNMRRKLAMLK
ncbi:sigma-70 family RNA polymerase sigma factor [Synergistaceae bacterium OttesenSCG-928-I11]|nr:sigma-70 family RNA polymerase sigma factor [Synergistaceae bacterium OttesenSCG-928-I11]